jgi:hypothetical protein
MRVRAASDPAWPIIFDPGLGSLYARKSIKLLLRPFPPDHNNNIAPPSDWPISKVGRSFTIVISRVFQLPDQYSSASSNEMGSRAEKQEKP